MTQFNYTVESVDALNGTMVLSYTKGTHPPIQVSTRLPYSGETTDQVADMFAPLGEWQRLESSFVVPAIGTTGTVSLAKPELLVEKEVAPIVTNSGSTLGSLDKEMVLAEIQRIVAAMNDNTL